MTEYTGVSDYTGSKQIPCFIDTETERFADEEASTVYFIVRLRKKFT